MFFCSPTFFMEFYHTLLVRAFVPSVMIGTILPNAVAIKSIGIYLHKRCSAFAPKMLVKLPLRANVIKRFYP
jgi:hypothetical protein